MKTFKQFCADHFSDGQKTNTGNLDRQRATAALDKKTRANWRLKNGKAGDFCQPETREQIRAARVLRKGGYLTNCLTWFQAGRGF